MRTHTMLLGGFVLALAAGCGRSDVPATGDDRRRPLLDSARYKQRSGIPRGSARVRSLEVGVAVHGCTSRARTTRSTSRAATAADIAGTGPKAYLDGRLQAQTGRHDPLSS
jgi:hypothetical protein